MQDRSNTSDASNCPLLETLISILSGERALSESDPLLQHVESCPHCARSMDNVIAHGDQRMVTAVSSSSANTSDRLEMGSAGNFPASGDPGLDSTRIPGFRILQRVNKGGQGIVYKATELATGESVALKWLPFSGAGDSEPANKEIAAAGRLDHPGIVKPRRQVDWSGQSVIVMDWVEGGDLRDFLDRSKISTSDSVDLMIRICRILEYAHGRGLIHRDLKPSNILLTAGRIDTPRLTDFGLAKFEGPPGDFSTVTAGIGTPGYMAPELVSADFGQISQATDIFSLGVILYELLTGELPFEGKTLFDFLRRTCDEPARPLRKHSSTIPLDLETICLKCLAKKQADRYSNASDLRMDLERFREGQPILAQRASRIDQLIAWAGRNPAVAVSATAAFVILSASVITLSILLERSRESQRIAENSQQVAEKSRLAEMNSRKAAENSLKLAVDAMTNAAPIYKRFAENLNAEDHELENLIKSANLSLWIGEGSSDSNVRCDSYFNTLQMAAAISHYPQSLDLAESITKRTLEKYRKLKSEHEDELRMRLRVSSSNDVLTSLDTVNTRIAFCLIELANIAGKRVTRRQAEHAEYIRQAVEQCELALVENPTHDEAMSMLGQYLDARTIELVANRRFDEALADMRRAIQYQKRFLDIKPSILDRYALYHGSRQRMLVILEKANPGTPEFRDEIQSTWNELRQLAAEKPDRWKEKCLWLMNFSNFITFEYDRSDPDGSARISEELLAILDQCHDLGNRDAKYRMMIFAFWLDDIANLVRHGKIERARQECKRILAWLDSLGRAEKADTSRCIFRLLCPLPEFRDIDEARRIAKSISNSGATVSGDKARIMKWLEILDNGIPVESDPSGSSTRDAYALWVENHIEEIIFDLLYRTSEGRTHNIAGRIEELSRIVNRNPSISPRWKCLLDEIKARANSSSPSSKPGT